jgi:hypothetical protein
MVRKEIFPPLCRSAHQPLPCLCTGADAASVPRPLWPTALPSAWYSGAVRKRVLRDGALWPTALPSAWYSASLASATPDLASSDGLADPSARHSAFRLRQATGHSACAKQQRLRCMRLAAQSHFSCEVKPKTICSGRDYPTAMTCHVADGNCGGLNNIGANLRSTKPSPMARSNRPIGDAGGDEGETSLPINGKHSTCYPLEARAETKARHPFP